MVVLGKLNIEFIINNVRYIFSVYIVDGLYYLFILGIDFLSVINIIIIFVSINIMYILDKYELLNVCVVYINLGLVRFI